MRDIDDHPFGLHRADDLDAERGEATLFQAVHRPRDFIVEEMRKSRHAEPRVIEPVEIGAFALEILQPFD